jgi:hypothetical protein
MSDAVKTLRLCRLTHAAEADLVGKPPMSTGGALSDTLIEIPTGYHMPNPLFGLRSNFLVDPDKMAFHRCYLPFPTFLTFGCLCVT